VGGHTGGSRRLGWGRGMGSSGGVAWEGAKPPSKMNFLLEMSSSEWYFLRVWG